MFEELTNLDDLTTLGEDSAREARAYLTSVTEVASGASPDTAIPILLLAVSQVLVAGARLGAITDIVPDERFEADPGPDVDVDPLRQGLVSLFNGLDDYVHVDGTDGKFQDSFAVYGRTGKPCPQCRQPIERVVIGQRSAHFCRHCQS